jgi:hypothetical protein
MVSSHQMNDLKPFAALGPGDIVGARRSQTAGNAIKETSIAFSEPAIFILRVRHLKTLAFSSNSRIDRLQDGCVVIENRPKHLQGGVSEGLPVSESTAVDSDSRVQCLIVLSFMNFGVVSGGKIFTARSTGLIASFIDCGMKFLANSNAFPRGVCEPSIGRISPSGISRSGSLLVTSDEWIDTRWPLMAR